MQPTRLGTHETRFDAAENVGRAGSGELSSRSPSRPDAARREDRPTAADLLGPARRPVWAGVATPSVAAGLSAVPPQDSSWSCGLNGAARGLAMMGGALESYDAFVRDAPRLDVLGITIGPPPARLAAYLASADGAPRGVGRPEAWSESHADGAGLADGLRAGWARGCPSLVLLRAGAIQLHWVLALGETADGAVCVLDSDGRIKVQVGGLAGLQERADLTDSLGFQFGFLQHHGVGRYNLLRFGRQGSDDAPGGASRPAPGGPADAARRGRGPRLPHRG